MMNTIKQVKFSHLPLPEDVDGRRVFLHQFLPASCDYEAGSPPCTDFLSSCQGVSSCASDQLRTAHDHQQQEGDQHSLQPTDIPHYGGLIINTSMATAEDSESEITKQNAAENSDPASSSGQGKWASPKMRFVRRMAADQVDAGRPRKSRAALHDQQQAADGGNLGGGSAVRVCSDCNTTKTPLWRSGPRGPKSLCNACGIRQRKARRAMAAAALTGGASIPSVARGKLQREKQQHGVVPFKKRCKFAAAAAAEAGEKKIQIDDLAISCGKNSGIHRVFPQEEKEAAMLLMSLSCRLIRG